jgi:hypothetical protein
MLHAVVKAMLFHMRYAGGVTVVATKEASGYSVLVEAAEPRGMVLHWAINDWEAPPPELMPEGTNKVCCLFY